VTVDPVLAVVIVSYECRELLDRCLASLFANLDVDPGRREIFVVDNGSHDGTPEMVASKYPEVVLLPERDNLGFSVANNLALRRARSPFVLVLNPDTEVRGPIFAPLVRVFDEHPDVGMVGCRLVQADGQFDHAAKRSFPTIAGALGHFTGVGRREGSPHALAQYRVPTADESGPVDAINGAFMLMRKAALDDVGLFDEGYWLYMEDLDLCYRFHQHAWGVWYEPTVTVVHLKGGTSGRHRGVRQTVAFHRGMYRFYRKFYAPERAGVLNAVVYMGIGAKLVVSLARNVVGRQIEAAKRPAVPSTTA